MFDFHDELEDNFNFNSFYILKEVVDEIEHQKALREFDPNEWNAIIDEWHKSILNEGVNMEFGSNKVQVNFMFYCLSKLISNEKQALKHAKLAQEYYIRSTLSYQWESVVYKALKEIYTVIPDCVLPNGRLPDLIVNPTYDKYKYHAKGWKITKADIIIDMKTSTYQTKKESRYYKQYCKELIIVYIQDSHEQSDKEISYLSADELKGKISNQCIIQKIEELKMKMSTEYILENFYRRFKDK